MAAEQLERSILENKERDELHAIASAMALKPAARSKKADIIDLILQATGVGAAEASNGVKHAPEGNGTFAGASSFEADKTSSENAPVAQPRPRRSPRTARATAVAEEPTTQAPSKTSESSQEEGNAAAIAPAPPSKPGPAGRSGATRPPMRSFSSDEQEPDEHETTEDAGAERSSPQSSTSNGSRTTEAEEGQSQGRFEENGQNRQTNGQSRDLRVPNAGQNDLGNRRSRRRRGRDRERTDQAPGSDAPFQGELVPVKGLLDLRDEGYGFLRTSGYLASPRDVYVSVSQARRFSLRRGDAIEGACRPAGPSEKYPALIRIDSICGLPPEEARQRPRFEDLTPLFPDERLRLEMPGDPAEVSSRIVDLISPIGKGQRGMIVSPPKAGKTTVMKQIAHSIEANNPEVHLIVLLVDERPEEVTDMRRSVHGEVIASTFDRPADEHTAVAELTIERAKRLVELGRDVVIILDGITRLARAYNLAQPTSGRIMSGGVDSGALYPPKKFFGAARNIEEGGSLTILATALVETGSRMDEVIFEEFKGTGNMELRLDRKLAERRLYPAIDVNGSSTRHEELLFDRNQLQQVWKLRRVLNALGNEGNVAAGLELLMDKIRTTRSNDEFLAEIAKAPIPTG